MDKDVQFIDPLQVERKIGELTVVVSPMSTRMLPQVLLLIEGPLLEAGALFFDQALMARLELGEPDAQDIFRLAALIGKHGDAIIDATAFLARVDKVWLGEQLPDRSAMLLADVVRVNADFFRRAMPGLAGLASLVQKAALEAPAES